MRIDIGRAFIKFGLIVVGLALVVGLLIQTQNKKTNLTTFQNQQQSSTTVDKAKESLSYKGEEGKDALTLLKVKAKIEQDKSGLVISINGRKANSSVHEYWAFYVNRKLAPVGPADYKTKDVDTIEWKIEKY